MRQLTKPLDSKPLEAFFSQVEDMQRQIHVGAERLAKAMEREKAKDEQIKTLEWELRSAKETIAKYDKHPDVVADKLAKLDAQEARIKAQRAQLLSPAE